MLRAQPARVLTASFTLLLLLGRVASAAEEPAGCTDAEARTAFVRERLAADDPDARRWMWEWGIAYTALALGQAGIALTRDDPGERADLYVGAAKSVLGLVPVLLIQVPALRDHARLEARLAAGDDKCAVAGDAERMLLASAKDEAFNRGFVAHAGNVLVNVGGLLVVGFGYDRWATGSVGAAIGIAIGELQIYTRPVASMRGLDEYRTKWTVAPMVTGAATGVQLLGAF
jgi:hypothetical protein